MAAVILYKNRILVFLVNNACMGFITSAMEGSELASFPYLFFLVQCSGGHMGLLLVGPGSTICKVQVEFADIVHGIAAGPVAVIILVIGCYAGPEGVFVRKGHIQLSGILTIHQCSAGIFHHFLSILVGHIHIAGDFRSIGAGFAVLHVDIDGTFVYAGCIVVVALILIFRCRNGTAAYGNFRISAGRAKGRAFDAGQVHRSGHGNGGIISYHTDTGCILAAASFSLTAHILYGKCPIKDDLAVLTVYGYPCRPIAGRHNIADFHRSFHMERGVAAFA